MCLYVRQDDRTKLYIKQNDKTSHLNIQFHKIKSRRNKGYSDEIQYNAQMWWPVWTAPMCERSELEKI